VTTAVVLDDHALRIFPGLDADLAAAGALVMRSFRNTPNPQLLRRHAGVGVVGGPDRAGLVARLERSTTTLASVPAPVIAALPGGVSPSQDLLGPGVVDLLPAGARRVAERILLMARVPVVTGARGRPSPPFPAGGRAVAPPLVPLATGRGERLAGEDPAQLFAIASSTGGVWVLAALLKDLSRAGRAVAVAQHMDAEFVPFFAEWLCGASGWEVVVVADGAALRAGAVFLPAGGMDLLVEGERVRAAPARSRFVPCADRLFGSAASRPGGTVGVVLSGMGADGAVGLAEIVRKGGAGVCQEPATAVVSSMPECALRASPGARVARPEALAATLAGLRARS
jgi:chemotaxis response regulator CheB